ncbi:hypothetical protein Mgra_00000805 [Meloidogyne graminicola]|uniref:Uncharacterized protein n=1 Tax=Meloidogyne graminicola TaxID=189291 RepID=A0A8T0A1D3_9BILA|nr:hypothetical protein Mgra_00000805 [Meloidogyne graminicola]
MFEINLLSFFGEFNVSKFIVYFCLLIFSIILSLRLDQIISFNYIIVFIPLWLGEICVFLGFLTAIITFIVRPASLDASLKSDFFSMCFQTIEHILLVMFQILILIKIEYYQYVKDQIQLSWLLVFSPLFAQSFMAMFVAIWCLRHEKPYEVLVPTWIVFSLFLLCSIYSLTIALFLNRTFYAHQQHIPSNRRPRLCASICHVFLTIPFLLHLLLLASKLDYLESPGTSKSGNTSFVLIALPMEISLFILLLLSFGARPANVWWFGMRQSFCNFIFEFFPCLRYYVNISCKFGVRGSDASNSTLSWGRHFSRRNRIRQNRNHQPHGNTNTRIYGIEEQTTPWVINSADEQQRIVITETSAVHSCEPGGHPQQSTSRLGKKQQEENREKEKQVIAYLFVRGSIESPD